MKFLILICLVITIPLFGISQDVITDSLSKIAGKYLHSIEKKCKSINDKIDKKTLKALKRLENAEAKITKHLSRIDSNYRKLTAGITSKYSTLAESVKTKAAKLKQLSGDYIPTLDSFQTSIAFLDKFPGFAEKLKLPSLKLDELQLKFQSTQKIKEYIKQRKAQLKEQLSKFTKLPSGLKKQYEKYSKISFYYSAQLKEYKNILHDDPNKIETKALSLLGKLPEFQKFMKTNGQLSALFKIPGDYGTAESLTGLQTRASVNELIQRQIASAGPAAQAQIQQNLSSAHQTINDLKEKINKLGGGSNDLDMPDFKDVNNFKTKSLLKRLEFGSNIQFSKANKYVPNSANLGLSFGFKVDDKKVIGLGASYALGIGDIRRINLTHNGIGLRSFIELKLKKQLYISGGYELNYNASFKNIEVLKNYNVWSRSGLLGLTKKYQLSKRIKGNMQILLDFLSPTNTPPRNFLIYRIGYQIK